MNYYIITGVSRGIGEAITRKLLVHGNTIFCTSRTMNEDLVETASALQIPLFYYETDLSIHANVTTFVHEVFSRIDPARASKIALINNAGMLEPIAPIHMAQADMIDKNIQLNLLAPALLISSFIQRFGDLAVPKVILNISSGASYYPYAGWALYCATKSGLDMLTRTVGLEQSYSPNPVKLLALAPGIVNTAMQTQIRHVDPSLFKEKEKFVLLHDEGKLASPDSVADVIVASLFNPEIPQGSILDIDQMKQYSKPA